MLGRGKFDHHFSTSANAGPLPQADAVGRFGSIGWGDAVKLMLKIEPDDGRIAQARFQAFGCSSAIAASAATTELITGKTLDEAAGLGAADIAAHLGGLPRERMYCAVMNVEALQQAIATYRGEAAVAEADAPPACRCLGVGQMMIERTIRFNRLTSIEQVTDYTKAAAGCSTCFKRIEALLARVNAEMVEDGLIEAADAYRLGSGSPRAGDIRPRGDAVGAVAVTAPPSHLRAALRPAPSRPVAGPEVALADVSAQAELIAQAIDDLRPHLQRDGGDCEFVGVERNVVYVRLSGNCVGCQLSSVTLAGVQAKLADRLGLPLRVVPVP